MSDRHSKTIRLRGQQHLEIFRGRLQTWWAAGPTGPELVIPSSSRFYQLYFDVRRDRLVGGSLGKFDADNCLARTCKRGDPNRAVMEHASASLFDPADNLLLLVLGISVDECRLHRLGFRQEVLLECPE